MRPSVMFGPKASPDVRNVGRRVGSREGHPLQEDRPVGDHAQSGPGAEPDLTPPPSAGTSRSFDTRRRQLLEPSTCSTCVGGAHAGDALISPSVTVRLLEQLAPVRRSKGVPRHGALSERELQLVASIAKGHANQEIAAEIVDQGSRMGMHRARPCNASPD